MLSEGQLVQRGTHEDLLAQGGLDRDLYERQFSVAEQSGDSMDKVRLDVKAF